MEKPPNTPRPQEAEIKSPETSIGLEEVVVLLAPDVSIPEDRLCQYLEKKNFEVLERKVITFDAETIQRFYPKVDDSALEDLNDFFSGEEVLALLIRGSNAIEILNRYKGHVRGILKLGMPSGIHASDSPEETAANKEAINLYEKSEN